MDAILVALYAVGALLGFGFVIAIHEFGHFLFAKWADVQVFRFSIGFGPVIFRRQWGETEYTISLLPFGGYVLMLGEDDPSIQPAAPGSGQPQPAARTGPDPRSLVAKSGWWRMWILLGGVLFNLISSVLLLLGLAFAGMPVREPVVGEVAQVVQTVDGGTSPSPATQLGLRVGDRIVAMNGTKVRMMDDLQMGALMHSGEPVTFEVIRDGQRLTLPPPGQPAVAIAYDRRVGGGSLGIMDGLGNRIAYAAGEDPAGGPRRGERVLAVAGVRVDGLTGQQINARLMTHFGKDVTLLVARDGETPRETTIRWMGTRPDDADAAQAGFPVRISVVGGTSPARGLLQPGDVVTAIDGRPVAGATALTYRLRESLDAERPIRLSILRDQAEMEVTMRGDWISGVRRLGVGLEEIASGVLPILPAGLDGGPSLLAKVGVAPGDVLLSVQPRERSFAIVWATPSAVRTETIDAAAEAALSFRTQPGLIQRLGLRFGLAVPRESLLAGLRLGTVVAAPPGTPATTVVIEDDGGVRRLVDLSGPAAGLAAHLTAGDRVVGRRLTPDGAAVEIVRGLGPVRQATIDVPVRGTTFDFDLEAKPYQLDGPGEAFILVTDAMHAMIIKSVQMIPKFFRPAEQGGIDATRTLQGPVGIFRGLWMQLEFMGFDSYLRMLAFIGLNLVLVNLLPIPITDGGQLVFLAIEKATGRPVTGWIRNAAMMGGVALVISLMAFTLGLDILRWIGVL
jgi:membrane-associated protease RseP (regulator of RpoE activity)